MIPLRFIMMNIAFALYAALVPPLILPFLRETTKNYFMGANPFIGALILVALAVELPALYYRLRQIGQRILSLHPERAGSSMEIPWIIPVALLHTAVGVSATMFAFRSFGLDFDRNEGMLRLFLLTAIARECYVFFLLFTRKVPGKPAPTGRLATFLTDAGLFVFTCVVFTATWQVIPAAVNRDASLGASIALFVVSAILFLMFYLPCNMAAFAEWFVLNSGAWERFLRWASVAVAVASAVGPMSFHGVINARANRGEVQRKVEMNTEMQKRMMEERRLLERQIREGRGR